VLSEDMTLLDTPIENWDRIRAATPAASFSPPSCRCPHTLGRGNRSIVNMSSRSAATPDKGAIE